MTKRRQVGILLVTTLSAALVYWATSVWSDAEPASAEKLLRIRIPATESPKLQKIVDVDFNGVPLEGVIEHLSNVTNERLRVDWTSLYELGCDRKEPVTLKLRQATAAAALRAAFHTSCFDEVALIPHRHEVDVVPAVKEPSITLEYDLSRLIDLTNKHRPVVPRSAGADRWEWIKNGTFLNKWIGDRGEGPSGPSYPIGYVPDETNEGTSKLLADVVTEVMSSDAWASNGGSMATLEVDGYHWRITAPATLHRQAADLLYDIYTAMRHGNPSPLPEVSLAALSAYEASRHRLASTVTVAFDYVPLSQAIAHIAAEVRVDAYVDFVVGDIPVDYRGNSPAGEILANMVHDFVSGSGRITIHEDGSVMLTQKVERIGKPWVFGVHDLLADAQAWLDKPDAPKQLKAVEFYNSDGPREAYLRRALAHDLLDVISHTICPHEWRNHGGLYAHGAAIADVLIIRGDLDMRREVKAVLDGIRQALAGEMVVLLPQIPSSRPDGTPSIVGFYNVRLVIESRLASSGTVEEATSKLTTDGAIPNAQHYAGILVVVADEARHKELGAWLAEQSMTSTTRR